jgi:hypothetical protein
MPTDFEKWWENEGYFEAKKKGLLTEVPDAVEIARLAYQKGLYTSPMPVHSASVWANFKSHFIKCSCTCQQLECEVYDYKDGDAGVNFTMWKRGRSGKTLETWKERIRWCWHILTTGSLWADDIIATNQDARGLAEFILQNVPLEQSNEETKKQ